VEIDAPRVQSIRSYSKSWLLRRPKRARIPFWQGATLRPTRRPVRSRVEEMRMEYVGGCQCGKIRYRAEGPPEHSSVCYCRMCQKAAGAPFMAFARFKVLHVHWTNSPAIFASSNFVERGFCRDCGTPLSYHRVDGPNVSVTIASLDNPEAVRPELRYSPDGELSWCRALSDLPTKEMDMTDLPGFENFQHPDA
jgi:hypothetical protein